MKSEDPMGEGLDYPFLKGWALGIDFWNLETQEVLVGFYRLFSPIQKDGEPTILKISRGRGNWDLCGARTKKQIKTFSSKS